MLRSLVRNTFISGTAFLLVGLVHLLVIPVIVRGYGLAEFGLITLARLLLPNGLLAMADCGVMENTTINVARARASQDWSAACQQLALLGVLSLAVGLALGGALILGARFVAEVLGAHGAYFESFTAIVVATGVALPLLFLGLVAEGVIKGFERYDVVRSCEVASVIGYATLTVAFLHTGLPYQSVAYAFLGWTVLKALGFYLYALRLSARTPLRFSRWDAANRSTAARRSILMLHNKFLGTGQTQLPTFLVGILAGPAATGIYDILARLPRFAKVALGLLNSALLPVAARLDERPDARLPKLGKAGVVLLPAAAFPLITAAMVFSEEILRAWIGPTLAPLWPWLTLMFLVPLIGASINFEQTLVLVRSEVIERLHRLLLLQLALQLGISIALAGALQERGFIIGQVAAIVAIAPFQWRILMRAQALAPRFVAAVLTKHMAVLTVLTVVAALAKRHGLVGDVWTLGAALIVWCSIYWALSFSALISAHDREDVRKIVAAAFGR